MMPDTDSNRDAIRAAMTSVWLVALLIAPATASLTRHAAAQQVDSDADPVYRRIVIDQVTGVPLPPRPSAGASTAAAARRVGHSGVRVEVSNGVRVYRGVGAPYQPHQYDDPVAEPEPAAAEPAPSVDDASAPAVTEPRPRYRTRPASSVIFILPRRRPAPGAFKKTRRFKRSTSKTTTPRRSMRHGRRMSK